MPAGGAHARAVQAEASGVQIRFAVVVTASRDGTPGALHAPTTAAGGAMAPCPPQRVFARFAHIPLFAASGVPVWLQLPLPIS